jgi:hypothetical protein
MVSRTVRLPQPLWEALDLIVDRYVGTMDEVMESAVIRHVSSVSMAYTDAGLDMRSPAARALMRDFAEKLMELNGPYFLRLVSKTRRRS